MTAGKGAEGEKMVMEGKTMNINVGDVVKLKSGGPKMTVEKIDTELYAVCWWFDKNEEAKTSKFCLETLMTVQER
jgi:uncharacterized protein YodC (DUF2158 family)